MLPTLALRCAHCNARIKAPVKLVGQVRPCPGCGQPLAIPLQVPPEAGPKIVFDDRALGAKQPIR